MGYIEDRVAHLLETRAVEEMIEAAGTVPNLSDTVGAVLDTYPGNLSPEQCVELCNTVAWQHRMTGWGISTKNGGNRANRYDGESCALDILHHKPTGIVVDCLGSSGVGRPSVVWIVHGVNTQADRPWLAPIVPQVGGGGIIIPPIDPPKLPRLDRGEFYQEMQELDRYYTSDEGLHRANGLSKDGKPDFEGLAAWIFDIYLNARLAGISAQVARELYKAEIRKSGEWKGIHP